MHAFNSDTLYGNVLKYEARTDVDENNFSKLSSAICAIEAGEEPLSSLPQLCRTRPYAPRVIRTDVNARSLPQTIVTK